MRVIRVVWKSNTAFTMRFAITFCFEIARRDVESCESNESNTTLLLKSLPLRFRLCSSVRGIKKSSADMELFSAKLNINNFLHLSAETTPHAHNYLQEDSNVNHR